MIVISHALKCGQNKVGCVFPMVISSELRMGRYSTDDHWEDEPHFIKFVIGSKNWPGKNARGPTTLKDTLVFKFYENWIILIKMTMISLIDRFNDYVKSIILIWTKIQSVFRSLENLLNFNKMTAVSLIALSLNILIKINVNLTFGG